MRPIDQPLQIIVTDSAKEVYALRNLLRHASAALNPAKQWPEWEREGLALHIDAVLNGAEQNDYLTCGHCGKPPLCCQCPR